MTKRTITALFDEYGDAAKAVSQLKEAGIPEADISLLGGDEQARASSAVNEEDDDNDAGKGAAIGGAIGGGAGLLAGLGMLAIPGLGPVVAAGWLASTLVGMTAGAATGGIIGSLTDAGLSEQDAHAYAEGVRRGGTLVTARVDEPLADRAIDILDDEGTVNMNEREAAWRNEGWGGRFGGAVPSAGRADIESTAPSVKSKQLGSGHAAQREGTIPVVEEELKVGKRAIDRGRVRVHSHVVERPVEEEVSLRDEQVTVERRPVNRPVSAADAMQDRVIEAQEFTEEPVVQKEARVKEEVKLRKDVGQRAETVRDKLRHTEVEVEDSRTENKRPQRVKGT